jgi:hypothetical protein
VAKESQFLSSDGVPYVRKVIGADSSQSRSIQAKDDALDLTPVVQGKQFLSTSNVP